MYQNSNHSGDPFAGQYPMPPPPPEQYQYQHQPSTPPAAASSTNHYSQPPPPPSSYYTPQSSSRDADYFQQQQQPLQQPQPYSYGSSSFDHPRHSYDPQTYHPHPNTSYYTEDFDTPETPIMERTKPQPSQPSSSTTAVDATAPASEEVPKKKSGWRPFKRHNKQEPDVEEQRQQLEPQGPRPAPVDEKPTYLPPPVKSESGRRGFCFNNPAVTCCSVFSMVVLVIFFASGIALMIASKVVSDKCPADCGGESGGSSYCDIVCSSVTHDALLYSGIVTTSLAAAGIVWNLLRWCCAGRSRKR